jgi:hypothetical protein
LPSPAPTGVLPDPVHEALAHGGVGAPEPGIVQRQNSIPQARGVEASAPVGPEVGRQEIHHLRCHPRSEVNTIGDVLDRHGPSFPIGPEHVPDVSGLLAVQGRNRVHRPGQADGERGHVKQTVVLHRVMAEAEERLTVEPHRLPVGSDATFHLIPGKPVVSGGNGRMRREDAVPPNFRLCLVQGGAS